MLLVIATAVDLREEHMLNRTSLTKLLVAAGLSLSACYPATTVEQSWTSPTAMQSQPLQRVVTVYFSDNETARRAGEDQLARELNARGVRATPAYSLLADNELTDSKVVKDKLLGLGFDGVVIMRLVDQREE